MAAGATGEPDRNYYQKNVDDVLKELGSSPKGISDAEAKKRLERYGPNEIRTVPFLVAA